MLYVLNDMKLRDLIPLSFKALLINKSRSLLTMLGIIIGITSVILMISVGEAAQNYLLSQISSFGSDLVFISNGKGDEMRGGPPSAAIKQTLTAKDFQKLESLDWINAVSTDVIFNELVTYGSESKNVQLVGTAPDERIIFNMSVAQGRFLGKEDIDSHARVVVLGQDVVKKLFGEQNSIGQLIKLGRTSYHVIGVMGPSGTRFFSNIDNQVYIPYTTLLERYNKNRLNFIALKSGEIKPEEAKERVRLVLRDSHRIENPQGILSKDDFRVASQEDAAKNANTIGSILQILLGSIASISLFVAGIGIMNIMYVTVTERTREIGLRKAIGATRSDVLGQFLSEAIVLTVVAGAIGILGGVSLSWLAIQVINRLQSGWSFVLPWSGIVLGFGVSAAIGIIFGYFPARRAAKLHPIDALRYE